MASSPVEGSTSDFTSARVSRTSRGSRNCLRTCSRSAARPHSPHDWMGTWPRWTSTPRTPGVFSAAIWNARRSSSERTRPQRWTTPPVTAHDRHPLDPPLLEKPGDLLHWRVLTHRDHVPRHRVRHPPALRLHVVPRRVLRGRQQGQPPRRVPLRARFGAPQEIPLADDPRKPSVRLDHGQRADPVPEQHPRHLRDLRVRHHGHHVLRHDVSRPHGFMLSPRRPTLVRRARRFLVNVHHETPPSFIEGRTGADATRHAGPATTSDRRRRVRGGNERRMQPDERRDRVASRRQAQRNDEDRGHHDQQQTRIPLRIIAVQGAQARSDDQQDRHGGDDPWQRLSCSHTHTISCARPIPEVRSLGRTHDPTARPDDCKVDRSATVRRD